MSNPIMVYIVTGVRRYSFLTGRGDVEVFSKEHCHQAFELMNKSNTCRGWRFWLPKSDVKIGWLNKEANINTNEKTNI